MSLSHFDEVYDICCGLSEQSGERDERPTQTAARRGSMIKKELKPIPLWQEELSDEHLYEKV